MNLLYVSSSRFPPVSANAIQVLSMCRALCAHGVTVDLMGFGEASAINCTDGEGIHFRARRYSRWGGVGRLIEIPSLTKYLRDTRPDVVYSRCPYAGLASIATGRRLIYEVHHPPKRKIHDLAEKAIVKNKSTVGVVHITHALRAWYERHRPEYKLTSNIVLPDGAWVRKRPDKIGCSANSGFMRLGYFGSSLPGKGVDFLVRLAPYVYPHRICLFADWRPGTDCPENVDICGRLEHEVALREMENCDVLLLPNKRDVYTTNGVNIGPYTSPLKLFEYMAAGRPVIASNIAPITEVMRHGENALLAPPGDVEAWTERVFRLCADRALARRLATAARFEVETYYDWRVRARKVLGLLESSCLARE